VSLSCRGLAKSFGGRRVLSSFDLDVRPGEVHGLLGPNGAGKTTAFRLLTGVERADSGSIQLDGRNISLLPLPARARLGLGYLPQEETLLRDLNVEENVALAISVARTGLDARALLERAGIKERARDRLAGLSGGERRRLAIARLLALKPKVLLLDEPFAGVDPVAVQGFQQLVCSLAQDGVAVLITDHAVRETLAICHQATLLDAGTVQVSGTPEELANHPHARARYLGHDFILQPRS
jgi:lipopolysaccharide export system ATP-binding protein